MNQSTEVLPNPKAIALIANITQLMNEVEQMLCDSNNQQEEVTIDTHQPSNEDLQARVAAFFTNTGRKIAAGARRTDQIVCDHPYQSLAIALGTGALLGLALVRRTDSPV
jgi:ElaB/YqjD/DUF883 family membrane-anchored ribosome-binding protein